MRKKYQKAHGQLITPTGQMRQQDSRRISKDSRRDSRHSAESESGAAQMLSMVIARGFTRL